MPLTINFIQLTVYIQQMNPLLKCLLLILVLETARALTVSERPTENWSTGSGAKRLLQTAKATDNPSNPTGPDMRSEVDFPAKVETLTAKVVNLTAIASGQDTSGNWQLVDTNETAAAGGAGKPASNTTTIPKKEPVQNATTTPSNNTAAGNVTAKPVQPLPAVNTTTGFRPANGSGAATSPAPPVSNPPQNASVAPINPTIATAPTTTTNLFSQSDNLSALTLDGNLFYEPKNVDDLINQDQLFDQGLTLLRAQNKNFLNNSQLVDVGQAAGVTNGTNLTVYQVLYRVPNGTYLKTGIIANPLTKQVNLLNTTVVPATSSPVSFMNSDLIFIDGLLRKIFKDYIAYAQLTNASQNSLNSFVNIYLFRYNGANGVYDATARNNNGTYTIMNFNKVNGTAVNRSTFSILPSLYWTNEQEYITASKAMQQFINKRVAPAKQDILSAYVTALPNDRLLFCNAYLIDGNFTQVCASISLVTRVPAVEYYYVGVMNMGASSDGYNENEYMDMINDPIFRLLDQTARSQYKSLLTGVPISKIETKTTPTGKAYRVTYLGDKQNIQVSYAPPATSA